MAQPIPSDLWYKDTIFYNLNIRSFYDSNGDGIGDFEGLIDKLDYLEELGVTAILLQPFYPSPMRDGGYDIIDHRSVHPDFGDNELFQRLIEELHQRNMRLVIDVVVNHTSIDHPWFQRARKASPDSPERHFYIWSDDAERFEDAAILLPDEEKSNWEWDKVAQSYYWHRFSTHEADLNYDNEVVRSNALETLKHWLDLGVDGFRLMSISYVFQEDGTTCEDLARVHSLLRELRTWIDDRYENRILIAETNLWPEQAARYFGSGDECHMNYNFPLMPRLFMALQTEDRYPIEDVIAQTPTIPDRCQWMLFLRNHDDLTLRMVTEEERDFLLRTLAPEHQARHNRGIVRRLAPLVANDRRKIELLHTIVFSLPGSPVIYYGDEIGMGDNIYLSGRDGIRTPMQWSDDRNAGFSTANPQSLFLPVVRDPQYRYESINVDMQTKNPASLWWWMKSLISVRKRHRALSRGTLRFLDSGNSKVLAYLRQFEGENILVVVNLSQHAQPAEIDLSQFAGSSPLEIFSQSRFFDIETTPYRFTLSPYIYYWFLLEDAPSEQETVRERVIPEIESPVVWENIFGDYRTRRFVEKRVLPQYLRGCRWFTSKGRKIVTLQIQEVPSVVVDETTYYLLILHLRYADGLPETYLLPVAFIQQAEEIVNFLRKESGSVICHLETPKAEGIIIDALFSQEFRDELFWLIKQHRTLSTPGNRMIFEPGKLLQALDIERSEVAGKLLKVEQSNTSVIYNDNYFFKIYRKLDTDINPDLELVRFLSERTSFQHCPRYGGGVELRTGGNFSILGLLQNKIPNKGEAWTLMLRAMEQFYSKVLAAEAKSPPTPQDADHFDAIPERVRDFMGRDIYDRAALLGQRTGEMHIALASNHEDPAFAPEPFTQHYQRSLYSGYRKLMSEKLGELQRKLDSLPNLAAAEARRLLARREEITTTFQQIYADRIDAVKTRIHGDYHLGQVLYDDADFYIIDFEGEPLLSISERRLKRTPFKDVAGMIRSFHYAALGQLLLSADYKREDLSRLENWGQQWYHYVRQAFLRQYLTTVQGQPFVPRTQEGIQLLISIYTLEKAIYEVGYELNSRPDWLRIPLRGALYTLNNAG